MIREAVKGDEALIETYLAKHFTTAMFMRGNLRDFGIGNTEAPYGMRFFIHEKGGIGGVGNAGAVMLQTSRDPAEMVAHMRTALPAGFKPTVTTGAPEMVAAIVKGFGMANAPTQMNDTEPLFLLPKAALVPQDMSGFTLRPATMEDLPLLAAWNHAYSLEVHGCADNVESRAETRATAERTIAHGRQRLLLHKGEVVAQTSFTAAMPGEVQVGGVFTPPALRGQGFARRAVAAHLAEAFATGAKNAILFSASDSASKAYRAIGFREIGTYQIVRFGGQT